MHNIERLILMLFLIIFLTIAIFSESFAGPSLASDNITKQQQTFSLHFDKLPAEEISRNISIRIQGGTRIPKGVSGHAWRLTPGDYLSLDLKDKLNTSEGTVMLWVRPHWQSADTTSHTFLSFTWSGKDRAYGTLSRGWWEPAGAKRTYFILNNQDHAHVSKLIEYEPNGWTHLACTWKAGNPGYLRLYVNGFKAAAGQYTSKETRHLASPIYIGSDQGSPLTKERWADSDVDELILFPQALSDEEIFAVFKEQKPPTARKPKRVDGKLLETRAIFDEGIGWATETGARKTIERIKRAGFNVYIPCVWHGRGTRYPTGQAPPEPKFTILTADPLKRLIDIAHENEIEVHPWFCVALRQREFFPEFYGPGTPDKAFDLHRPAFQTFITDLIADVVRRYNVDGVNLDYIRTMGLCTCDFCQREYHQTTGRDLLHDIAQTNSTRKLQPELHKWQASAVEEIVRQVKEKCRAIKPRLIISVCGHPLLGPSREGREEISWANAGLVDLIFNMDYQFIPDFERQQILRNRLKNPDKLVMLLANYQRDKVKKAHIITDPAYLVRLIDNLQYRWPGGVGVYIYSLLSDIQIKALDQGPFQRSARPAWAPED
jgi:uncharacterized lipoprotein YddW (UPF0748 family)